MTSETVSFEDLGEVTVIVPLVRPDGRQLNVPMRTLSDHEIWELRAKDKRPAQPIEIRRWDGPEKPPRPGPVTSGAAYDKYVLESAVSSRRWNRLLMLKSILMDIPGETDDEKIEKLEQMGAWALRPLTEHLNRLLGLTETEVQAKADSFQRTRDSDTADTEGTGMDAA